MTPSWISNYDRLMEPFATPPALRNAKVTKELFQRTNPADRREILKRELFTNEQIKISDSLDSLAQVDEWLEAHYGPSMLEGKNIAPEWGCMLVDLAYAAGEATLQESPEARWAFFRGDKRLEEQCTPMLENLYGQPRMRAYLIGKCLMNAGANAAFCAGIVQVKPTHGPIGFHRNWIHNIRKDIAGPQFE